MLVIERLGNVSKQVWRRTLALAPQYATFVVVGAVIMVSVVTILSIYGFGVELVFKLGQHAERQPRLTAILLDTPDESAPTTLNEIKRWLVQELVTDSHRGDRVLVAQVTDQLLEPVNVLLEGTDPGQPDDCNVLVCSVQSVKKLRQAQYIAPFVQALDHSLIPTTRKTTPLIEANAYLSRLLVLRDGKAPVQKKLIVVTDGLQNTAGASVFATTRPNSAATKPNSIYSTSGRAYVSKHIGLFKDVEVIIVLIRHPSLRFRQDLRLRDWLEEYYAMGGARSPIRWVEIW